MFKVNNKYTRTSPLAIFERHDICYVFVRHDICYVFERHDICYVFERHDICYVFESGVMKGIIKLHNPGKFLENNGLGSHFRDLQKSA